MFGKVLVTLFTRSFGYVLHCYREIKWDATLALKGYIGDKKLGIDTGWYDYINAHVFSGDSFRYEPTSYAVLKKITEVVKFNKEDVFIDYGCGKGRVIFAMATQKLKKVIGIEYDNALVKLAHANHSRFKFENTPVEIIHADANNFDPIQGTIIFLGNPFGEKTLQNVMDNIGRSLIKNPRNINIIYYNSTGKGVFEKIDWLEFDSVIDQNYSGTTIWRNKDRMGLQS